MHVLDPVAVQSSTYTHGWLVVVFQAKVSFMILPIFFFTGLVLCTIRFRSFFLNVASQSHLITVNQFAVGALM